MARILDEEHNPLVGALMLRLRCVEAQKDRGAFRAALAELGRILGYEIARTLPQTQRTVRTPLGSRAEPVLESAPVLATVMRAGVPLFDGILAALPESDCMFFGAARREGAAQAQIEIDCGYSALSNVAGRTLIYADPMLATGSTLRCVHEQVLQRAGTPARVIVAAVIAYRPTLALIEKALNAEVFCASADDTLNERGYIVPGLGDAGDLAFGERFG